ncbi:hypothetical protein [Methylobacterium sp. sgz302541]|uniref:hypothetical protein n=1 Tax=unclassified Methylobacterium TaxID=2615210 RepID=UPI003D331BE9
MASTLGDLLSEVMDDLDRPDLDPQIRRAVAAAVRRYQPERLAFNERMSKSVGTGPRIGVQWGPLRKLGTVRLS